MVCIVVALGQGLGAISQRMGSSAIAEVSLLPTLALFGAAVLGAIAAWLNWRIRLVARLTMLTGGVALFFVLYLHGGLTGFHASSLLVIPALVSLVLGGRDTAFFGVFCLLSVAGLYLLDDQLPRYALSAEERLDATLRSLVFSTVVILISLLYLVRESERSDDQLRALLRDQAHAATHDAMTGLANRAAMDRALAAWEAETRPLRLFLIDLDGFKDMNDTFGHAAGDAVLIDMADRLRALAPDGALIARMGGDEFLLATPMRQAGGAESLDALGHRLAQDLRAHKASGPTRVAVTASVGSADFPGDSRRMSRVLAQADRALYVAKHQGKARFIRYHPDSDAGDESAEA